MRYLTRNNAFMPMTTWVLDGAGLTLESDKGPSRTVPLAAVRAVRLEFAPTRPEQNRFRCRLELVSGERLEFFNRRYAGVYDFHDTSADYTAFVRALVAALPGHSPSCQFLAGATDGVYVANLLVAGVLGAGLILAAGWLYLSGFAWLIVVKLVLLAACAPMLIRWITHNRPHTFPPEAIPADLLPAPAGRRP